MKEKFKNINFKPETLSLIATCNEILTRYAGQGYDMTLRQLYYQLVASDLIRNNSKQYDRLGDVVSNARIAGLIDWNAIVDRTRSLRGLSHWDNPEEIVKSAAQSYAIDKWAGQPYRIEVWIEKDALAGVFERVCNSLDVPFFSCRGYTSQSEMYAAAKRLYFYVKKKQTPLVLHFGDHDPSGLDMTRDIEDRLNLFTKEYGIDVKRLALNMDQVNQYEPPPNPAKLTDSRCSAYIKRFGAESWELDALEPNVLAALVRESVESVMDADAWEEAKEQEAEERKTLEAISDNYSEVKELVRDI